MKHRTIAWLLLAIMVLLVGMIPAAQAKTPAPEGRAFPEKGSWDDLDGERARDVKQQRPRGGASQAGRLSPIDKVQAGLHQSGATASGFTAADFSIAATVVENEPNDDWSTADAIEINDFASGIIDPIGDEDFYKITVEAGDYLHFKVIARLAGSTLDPVLILYDTDGVTELAYNDDYYSLDSQINYYFLTGGTYYLKLYAFSHSTGGPDNWYMMGAFNLLDNDTAVIRASVDSLGMDGTGDSDEPSLSADGRYVAFKSGAANLVPNDTNGVNDVFVRDTQTNTIERVSISSAGEEGNSESFSPSISADGRYVVFTSYATNLDQANEDNNGAIDIYLHDRQEGETILVSVNINGEEGSGFSADPVISANGEYIAFTSSANDLIENDSNFSTDVFRYEIASGDIILISQNSDEVQGNSDSYAPSISEDGSFVAFASSSTNLGGGAEDNNSDHDVFVRDVGSGTTVLVSSDENGDAGNFQSTRPSISDDGKKVAFFSLANNLVEVDTNNSYDVFVRDLENETTTLISKNGDDTQANGNSDYPKISGDGRYVVFTSTASNLLNIDINEHTADVFVHDLQTSQNTLVSQSATGDQGMSSSGNTVAINEDGSVIAYNSFSFNLVDSDWYSYSDVYVRYTGLEATHSISGQVVDENNEPICCVSYIWVRDISGAIGYADDNGNYIIAGLLPGQHGVWAYDEELAYSFSTTPIEAELPPNMSNVNIEGEEIPYTKSVFTPTADAYVDESKINKNFGTQPTLRLRDAAKDLNSYLKFEVSDLPDCVYVQDSELVLYASDGGPDGGEVFVTSNNWTEKGINWKNAPPSQGYVDWLGQPANNTYASADVYVEGNGTYSYMIHNYSNDMVKYHSREGANKPELVVRWAEAEEQMPVAYYDASTWYGTAPLTVQFYDDSFGCVNYRMWDFDDGGAVSYEANPTYTFTEPGNYFVSLYVSNDKGSDQVYFQIEVLAPPELTYISLAKAATIDGIQAAPSDILEYDKANDTWRMFFDASDYNIKKNLGSFAFDGDDLLLSFTVKQTIPGVGTVTPYDIVRFTPDDPDNYPLGSGEFTMYFQGKPLGLSKGAEKIDALTYPAEDIVLLSTTGNASVPSDPVLKVADEDLFWWDNSLDGGWNEYPFLDGSILPGLAAEDIVGVYYDDVTNDVYLILSSKFDLGGVKGNATNIVRLSEASGGYGLSLYDWLAPDATFKGKIDALEMRRVDD